MSAIREVLPGIHHWTALHEGIGMDVSSYYLAEARAAVDPMVPPEDGVEWFGSGREPHVVLLTNRHHLRHSERFVGAFGCPVLCHESGLHEFEGRAEVRGFRFGDEVAPGVVAREVGSLCPDDSALEIATGGGVLAFADGVVHYGDGRLGFVPEQYMGDDPEGVKRRVREALGRLVERDFDTLLFAHGEPIVGDGKPALRRFVDG